MPDHVGSGGLEDGLSRLGLEVVSVRRGSGGDTCRAWRVELVDGSCAFVKQAPPQTAGMPQLEAAGLTWLESCGAEVPRVLAADSEFLVLSWVDAVRATPEAAAGFGATLARMHSSSARSFGCPPPQAAGTAIGWVGPVRVPFGSHDSWAEHYVADRLVPAADAAQANGGLTTTMRSAVDDLFDALLRDPGPVVGPSVDPAPIHGDLWSGNVMWQESGAVLVDPAASGGHPETDLAMLVLFGTPQLARVLAAYESVRPLPLAWRSRIPLHQVFPLLVHAAMFGAGYGAQAAEAARAALVAAGQE